MIVWGGVDESDTHTRITGIYDPSAAPGSRWVAVPPSAATPSNRKYHTAVWASATTEMIVWGGASGTTALNTGGRYNPSTNTWASTTLSLAPSARLGHSSIWTGTEMIVWGGRAGASPPNQPFNNGRRYNPTTNTWSAISALNAPSQRTGHSAVWASNEGLMIVWGGSGWAPPQPVSTGARYNPVTDTWFSMNNLNAPVARADCTTIWTGSEMIVWGGSKNPSPNPLGDGGIYNPASDSLSLDPWRQIESLPDVPPRRGNAAVWMDEVMAVWGGLTGPPTTATSTGCALRPECGHWGLITESGAPIARESCSSVWTGQYMIIWGGRNGAGNVLDNGKRWQPPASIAPTSYEMQINSAQIAAASLTYQLSSYTPAIVTVTGTALDRNGKEVGGRSVNHCLDVERHRYNKGCWSKP